MSSIKQRLVESLSRHRYNWHLETYSRALVRFVGMRVLTAINRSRWILSRMVFGARNGLLHDRPVVLRVGETAVQLEPVGAVATEVWFARRYEQHELGLILRAVQPESTFLDVGSNVGLFGLAVARRFPDVQVFTVEPAEATFRILERNVRLNGLRNVASIHAALADYVGTAHLNLNSAGRDGLNTLGVPTHPDSHTVGRERVSVITLDDLARQHTFGWVSAIKLDVEGGELGVFLGGRNLLRSDNAPVILYEGFSFCTRGFGYHPVELMWLLEDWGYATFVLDATTGRMRTRPRDGRYDAMMVAVKPGHPFFEQAVADAAA